MSDGRREISARPPTRLGSRVSAPSVNYSVALFKTPSRKRGRVHRKDLPACLALCGAVIGSAAEKLALWSSRHGDSPPSRHHSLLFYIQRNSLSGRRGRRGARLLASSFKCNFIETFRAALQNFNTQMSICYPGTPAKAVERREPSPGLAAALTRPQAQALPACWRHTIRLACAAALCLALKRRFVHLRQSFYLNHRQI